MSCTDDNPKTFADNKGLVIDCCLCGKLVKFMHETEEQLREFHRHGRICNACQIKHGYISEKALKED